MKSSTASDRKIVSEAHLSMSFHPTWPLTETRAKGQGAISQYIPDVQDGAVFLHYGPGSTVETYKKSWQAKYGTKLTVQADSPIKRHGLTGRRLVLMMAKMPVKKSTLPSTAGTLQQAGSTVIPAKKLVCVGYTIRKVPVLVGYLLPKGTTGKVVRQVESIIASVRPLSDNTQ